MVERQGLAPSVAVRSRSSVDRWGHEETEYVDGDAIGHVQRGLSPFGFLGQPLGGSQVMIMPIANFSEKKGPVLFRDAVGSEYRWQCPPNTSSAEAFALDGGPEGDVCKVFLCFLPHDDF